MAERWELQFRPGLWEGNALTRVPPQGQDCWELTDEQLRDVVAHARGGGYWDEEWEPKDFSGVPQWVLGWAVEDPTGTRQYDFLLVAPGGSAYSEDDVRRGYADDDLARAGLA